MGVKISNGGRFALGQNADINVTPFVDVLLVLLIIFMLAIPLATVSIKIDFPTPGGPIPNEPSPIISVEQQGRLYIGSREVTLASLNAELAKALGVARPTDERVSIRANRDVEYRDFIQVMNTLKQGGYAKVGILTENL